MAREIRSASSETCVEASETRPTSIASWAVAAEMARSVGAHHESIEITEAMFWRHLPEIVACMDDPAADYAIVTSDNPRKEPPETIIQEIETGFRGKNYEAIMDRREAIFHAISLAQPRDIVLIAGKGHETTQEFADHTIPFDDVAKNFWQ